METSAPRTGQRLLRFSSMMSTALAMAAAVAHLLELPAKRRYEAPLYVKLHRTLYWNFGRVSGPAEAAAVLTTGTLAWGLRRDPTLFAPVAAASACLAAAHGAFWAVVSPMNREMLRWPLTDIPDDWTTRRDQWEFGHAARACLLTGALGALAWSAATASNESSEMSAAA